VISAPICQLGGLTTLSDCGTNGDCLLATGPQAQGLQDRGKQKTYYARLHDVTNDEEGGGGLRAGTKLRLKQTEFSGIEFEVGSCEEVPRCDRRILLKLRVSVSTKKWLEEKAELDFESPLRAQFKRDACPSLTDNAATSKSSSQNTLAVLACSKSNMRIVARWALNNFEDVNATEVVKSTEYKDMESQARGKSKGKNTVDSDIEFRLPDMPESSTWFPYRLYRENWEKHHG